MSNPHDTIRQALIDARSELVRQQEGWTKSSNRFSRYQHEIDDIDAALAYLDTLAAGQWTPVPDGEYPMVENAEMDSDFLYITGNTDPEVCTWIERPTDIIMLDLGMKICQRAAQPAQEMPAPSWADAPEWAQWWACDAVGWAQWYMVEPYCDKSEGACWCPQPVEGDLPNQIDSPQWDRRVDIPLGIDWRTTLRARPATGEAVSE